MSFGPKRAIREVGCALACAALLSSACAGKAEQKGNGQSSAAGSSVGGSDISGGGSVAGAGAVPVDDGGATAMADAGAAGNSDGGAIASGGRGGAGASGHGGSGPVVRCDKVVCPAIPTTCKHLVQGVNDCCPTCTDSGCETCAELNCEAGTHSESKATDCCPSCVADPPDVCIEGHKAYDGLREILLDKYTSVPGCKNSAECAIVNEDTACGFTCNIPLPASTSNSFVTNMQSVGQHYCTTCEAPVQVACDPVTAACLNGKCVAADVQ